MTQRITVRIPTNGLVGGSKGIQVGTSGFTGGECQKATENFLGRLKGSQTEEKTAEFYETEVQKEIEPEFRPDGE